MSTARRPVALRGRGLDRERRRDSVAVATEQLRRLILSGEIAPGAELSQVGLAEMIGVSTTPVREALRQLEVEGLVQSRLNRRPRVPDFDPADLDAVYCSRILLEAAALQITVPAMSATDLAAIEADLESMRAAGVDNDLAAWDEAHSSFHTRLVSGCEPALRRQIRLMMSRADRYRRMSVIGDQPHGWIRGDTEHEAIAVAAGDRDAALAANLLASHLGRSAYSLLGHLDPDWQPSAMPVALRIVGAEVPQPNPEDPGADLVPT